MAVDLAKIVAPSGRVVGIDLDAVKIDIARAEAEAQHIENLEFRVADLTDCILPEGFDLVHARFVLSHLPNPESVLAKIRAALKPGGTVVISDSNFRGIFSHPDSPPVQRYVEIYTETLKRRNGDADIGVRLPELLARAGFEDVNMSVAQHAETSGDRKLITPMTLEGIDDAVIAEGVTSRAEVDRVVADLYDFARDPTTVLSGPRVIETWARRPTD